MFSLKIIDTDMFLDMPISARLLYYDLSMRADDDGFVGSPKKIQRMIGCSDDDMKLLIAKKFIIPFDTGVCVIRHWRIHNYIQPDRYTPTIYRYEKSMILQDENKSYDLSDTRCIQNVSNLDTQVRLGKVRLELGKDSVGKEKKSNTPTHHSKNFIPPTVEEIKSYCTERKNSVDPERFYDFYTAKGWMVGKNKMKDWKASVRTWERSDNRARISTGNERNNGTHTGKRKEEVPKYGEVL